MMQYPAISVVLPVFNGEAYVREAVESILEQTFQNFELIIINDGSTDRSGAILRELSAHDNRIMLVERKNVGLVATLNEGIKIARGKFIARMDADDVAAPERFALQYARMMAMPNLGVLGSFIRIIDKAGNFIRRGEYPVTPLETAKFLEYGCPVGHPTVMMRRDAIIKVGGYRKAFTHCEDYDLWLRISEVGYSIANLPQLLLNYRVHGANVSAVHRDAQELGSVVARVAHRARKAGLSDPTEGVDSLDLSIIDKVPAYLRQDVDADFLALRYSNVSLMDINGLERAWCDYKNLGLEGKQNKVICGFLMRLLNGALRMNAYSLAAQVFFESMRWHSAATLSMFWFKVKITLMRLATR